MSKMLTGAVSCALAGVASVAAAGATITVTHDLEAARPAEIVSIPFAEIAAAMPEARMYHLVVRDPKGRALPSQITNYEHDHRGVKYDDLVFSYDFAAGEKRATFTLENLPAATPPEPRLRLRALRARAFRRHRLGERPHRASHVRPRAELAGAPAWNGCAAAASTSGPSASRYPIVDRWYAKGHDQFHKDGEGEGLDLYSIGGSRGAGGTGIWDGTKLWTSDNFVERAGAVERPAARGVQAHLRALGRGRRRRGHRDQAIHRRLRPQLRRGRKRVRFRTARRPWSASASREHRRPRDFPRPCSRRDPDGRWMSFWEENKDGGLGIAVILGERRDAGGLRARRRARSGRATPTTCCS